MKANRTDLISAHITNQIRIPYTHLNMIFLNPKSIMRTMVAFLAVNSLTNTIIVNAAPVSENEVSVYSRRAEEASIFERQTGATVCRTNTDIKVCTFTVTMNVPTASSGLYEVRLYDSSCNVIGGMDSPWNIDLASQLPYKIIGTVTQSNGDVSSNPSFWYAGRYFSATNACWIKTWENGEKWFTRCQFYCR